MKTSMEVVDELFAQDTKVSMDLAVRLLSHCMPDAIIGLFVFRPAPSDADLTLIRVGHNVEHPATLFAEVQNAVSSILDGRDPVPSDFKTIGGRQ